MARAAGAFLFWRSGFFRPFLRQAPTIQRRQVQQGPRGLPEARPLRQSFQQEKLINEDKSVMIPSQIVSHLGHSKSPGIYDVSLCPDKID